jgi:hypothetical protein
VRKARIKIDVECLHCNGSGLGYVNFLGDPLVECKQCDGKKFIQETLLVNYDEFVKFTEGTFYPKGKNQAARDAHLELYEIGAHMKKEKLPASFITRAVQTAIEFEGVYDLMRMWKSETDKNEKEEIVAAIQELVDACSLKEKSGVGD